MSFYGNAGAGMGGYGASNSYDDRYSDKSSYRGGGGGGGGKFGGGGGSYGGGGGSYGGGSQGMGGMGANLKTIHWDLSSLPVFEKNFYIEHPAVSKRDENFSEKWRRDHQISIIGRGVPKVTLTPVVIAAVIAVAELFSHPLHLHFTSRF
jgi:ATP-dependent RNA helicase DDX5/DBP2